MAKAKAPDAAEEAAEKPEEDELTPLGRRTLAGFKKRWGEEAGETKFEAALNSGVLDPKKMKGKTTGSEKD